MHDGRQVCAGQVRALACRLITTGCTTGSDRRVLLRRTSAGRQREVHQQLCTSRTHRCRTRCRPTSVSAQRSSLQLSLSSEKQDAGAGDTSRVAKATMRLFLRSSLVEEAVQELAQHCPMAPDPSHSIVEQVKCIVQAVGVLLDAQHLTASATSECGVIEEGASPRCN